MLTLVASSGKVFNITGDGSQNLIFRDCIVANSGEVGLIKGFSMVFLSIVQYVGNANGVTYENINRLLLSNTGWFGGGAPLGNSGTYEKLVGTFGSVQKQSGFSEVTGTNIGFDVSANPIITGDAVMDAVVFTGDYPAGYVNRYINGSSYTGYNFNNSWNVRCAGIPTEGDSSAAGNIYDPSNAGAKTYATNTSGYKVVTNATTATNLLRFDSSVSGRLTYKGKKTRAFQISTSLSFNETSGGNYTTYVFYIVKISANGVTAIPLPETETFIDTNSGYTQAFPITGSVTLANNESVEVWLKRLNNGNGRTINTLSFNLTAR